MVPATPGCISGEDPLTPKTAWLPLGSIGMLTESIQKLAAETCVVLIVECENENWVLRVKGECLDRRGGRNRSGARTGKDNIADVVDPGWADQIVKLAELTDCIIKDVVDHLDTTDCAGFYIGVTIAIVRK